MLSGKVTGLHLGQLKCSTLNVLSQILRLMILRFMYSDFLWCHEFLVNEACSKFISLALLPSLRLIQLDKIFWHYNPVTFIAFNNLKQSIKWTIWFSNPHYLSWQCAQAGGEHPLLCGSPGQPEAHWLLPEVSIWWWTPWPCQEKECQEGPGWRWRSWRRGGGLRRMSSRECVVMLPVLSDFNKCLV